MKFISKSNNEGFVNPSTQQAIENGCAWAGIDYETCVARRTNSNEDEAAIYDVFDAEEGYQFSIDSENDTIFSR